MNSKNRYLIALIAVSAFILLAGSFVVMAQDGPTVPSDDQKIGSLEQEVIELQNRIQALKTGAAEPTINNNILAPQPVDGSGRPNSNAPATNSVYPSTPPTQMTSPAGAVPQFGYNQTAPVRPWGVEPAMYGVPVPVEHYVPVQVPVYVEPPPCRFDYVPVCDHYLPPAIGLEFFFSGNGNGNHHSHKKHKH